jgi:diguanylate cyclase (GGDEF)-like protein
MDKTEGHKSRILIVDDDRAVRNLLETILCERHDCTLAASAEEALDQLTSEHYDLVVSDINMSGMTGIDMIPRILSTSPDTVVMMISGNQSIESPIEALRHGAFDYIAKPFDIDQVEIAVDRAIRHADLLSEKRRHEEQLEQLVEERTAKLNYVAYHDSLTGLPNRAAFEERLSNLLANDGRGAVFFVSLDRFRVLRDTLGQAFGISLLNGVSERLNRLSEGAATVARFEGDEFGLFVHGKDETDLAVFAEKIVRAFETPFALGDYEIYVTASIGISQAPVDGTDAHVLLQNAGAALSTARKQTGSSYQFYTSDINNLALNRLNMENGIRHGLERGEFEVYYQPKINTGTGEVCGMEALVRWNHPELGLVPPFDFISLAEETGLIIPLGEWILRSACTQTKLWHDKGFQLNVAVNLSPSQFQQKDLARVINDIVRESGLPPASLNLEVTESSIMNNPQSAVNILTDLRDTGIKISIDDFGTGYSSLGYLKHLPIDVLKIDRSFVSDVTRDPDDAALVNTVITLAHNLRLYVVAEGVETDEQLRLLRLLRCDEWQGYLFSKPIKAHAFEELLTNSKVQTV